MVTVDLTRVAVVATAQSGFRTAWHGHQHVDLLSSTVNAALTGTGLRIEDVDFVIDSGSDVLDGRSISNCGFLGAMGAHHKEESRVEEDGLWALMYATDKIASGAAKVGLVIAYSKPSESSVRAYYASQAEPFYQRPVGLDQWVAAGLMADQYIRATGADPAAFDTVATHAWTRAQANAAVQTVEPVDAAAVAAAPFVANPLRALHVARPLDGAVVIVLAAESVARKATDLPVYVTGFGTAMESQMISSRTAGSLTACATAARQAYRRAGISDPRSVGLVEVSANSAADELMILEALGLAEPGHGVDLYAGGGPHVNLSGGALPADPIMATGLVRLSEAVLQLTNQVDHAPDGVRTALVHGSGGLGMQNHCVVAVEV